MRTTPVITHAYLHAGYIVLLAAKTRKLDGIQAVHLILTKLIAGGQYTGIHFAAAGVYTGNALLLR